MLAEYPDTLLVDHLEFGWSFDYTKEDIIPTPTFKNHSIAVEVDFHILPFITTELKHEAFLGLFHTPPFPVNNLRSP